VSAAPVVPAAPDIPAPPDVPEAPLLPPVPPVPAEPPHAATATTVASNNHRIPACGIVDLRLRESENALGSQAMQGTAPQKRPIEKRLTPTR